MPDLADIFRGQILGAAFAHDQLFGLTPSDADRQRGRRVAESAVAAAASFRGVSL